MSGSNGKWVAPLASRFQDGWTAGTELSKVFQSLSSYLGGWQDWSSTFDVVFDAGATGSYTRGNATRFAEYKLQGDICDMRFEYVIGSTTTWPTNTTIFIKLPVRAAGVSAGNGVPIIGQAVGTDNSTGNSTSANVFDFSTASSFVAFFSGPANYHGHTDVTISEYSWFHHSNTVNPWPFYTNATTRAPWAANDNFRGTLRYRYQV